MNVIKYAAHQPRFVGSAQRFLAETQRSTRILRSENLGLASTWAATPGLISENTQVAPDGTLTADTFLAEALGAVTGFYQLFTVSPSTTYAYGIFVKLGTLPASDFRFAIYNATAGNFIASGVAPNVTPVTDEWVWVTYVFTTPAGCTSARIYPYRFQPVTGGTIHFWGADIQVGDFSTTYIPTAASAVTRFADAANIALTAAESLAATVIGIVYFPRLTTNYQAPIIVSKDGATTNALWWRVNSAGTLVAQGQNGGVNSQSTGTLSSPAGRRIPFAMAFDATGAGVSVDGGAALNFNGMVPPAGLNRLTTVGHGSFPTSVEIESLRIMAGRVPDAQLPSLAVL